MEKSPFRTLVIDDHDSSCFVLERIIKGMGHEVELAYNLKQAREIISEKHFDVFLVDWTLPDGSGLELIEDIRKNNPSSFVIVCTGKSEINAIQEAIRTGADYYLVKPIDKKTVEARVILGLRAVELRSQLHTLESELQEKVIKKEELTNQLSKAEVANKRKSEFLANLSHEIRTPINGIISLSTLLFDSNLDEQQKEDMDDLYECALNLKGIIGDILDFSKIEAGKLAILEAPFNLRTSLGQAVATCGSLAKKKNSRVIVKEESSISKSLVGDSARFVQIVGHLIGNALKFSPEESEVWVFVREEEVEGQNKVVLRVEDKGVGIPESKREEILLPFIQVDGSSTRKVGGAGLGLTLVKQLTELMGGEFWFRSEVGKGSTFYVSFPFEVTVPSQTLKTPTALFKSQGDKKFRILIAEDDPVNRDTLERILKKKDWEVVSVTNGEEALNVLNEDKFNFIILDLQMPVLNGMEVLRVIKGGDSGIKNVPTIMLTACALSNEREELMEIGADGFLVKPCDSRVLYDEIERLAGM